MHTSTPRAGDFSGLWIPLVTPFDNGAVDHKALKVLVQKLRGQGIAGFVACGSTGEAAALDDTEKLAVLDTVLASADGLPVVMGLSGEHLRHTVDWVRTLMSRPLAGLLVPAPHYVRPAQDGLLQWFQTIADASSVQLIVYDIPYRTGVRIARETMLALAAHPRIRAVKDCGGDAAKTLALIADGRLQVLAGEDLQMFATVAQGGAGAIAASAHLHTAAFATMLQGLAQGRLAQARATWLHLLPLVEALFAHPNPGPLKAILDGQGLMRNALRAPMTTVPANIAARLLQLDEDLTARLAA